MSRRPRLSLVLEAVGLTLVYLAVVAWLTWPLAASAWSRVSAASFACLFDLYYSAWALAHGSRALVAAPFGDIYHPSPGALFYGPAAIGALPLFAPAYLATGNPAFAINVTFLGGLALTGAAMHAVVRRWTGSHAAAAVGATTVLLNQWLIWLFVPSAPHWAPLFGFPLIAFAAATRLERPGAMFRLVPVVVLQCLVDVVYVAPAVLAPLGVLIAIRFVRRRTRSSALRLLAVVALGVLFLVPVLLGYLRVQRANPDLAQQTIYSNPDPKASPPFELPGDLVQGVRPFLLTPVAMTLIPLGALVALARRRAGVAPKAPGGWSQGTLWTLVGVALSLTPVTVIGSWSFTSPMGLAIAWLPSLQAIRVTSRLGIAGLMGLGILTGVAFGEIAALLTERVRRPRLALAASAALAALAIGLGHRAYATSARTLDGQPAPLPAAYPVQVPPEIPAAFEPVLASSRAPLLEVPCDVTGLQFLWQARATYRAILHGHPVLNGYASYWPAAFTERMADGGRLPAVDALERLARDTGLGLVWVHLDAVPLASRRAWQTPPAPDDTHPGLALVAHEGPELLFAVRPPTGR